MADGAAAAVDSQREVVALQEAADDGRSINVVAQQQFKASSAGGARALLTMDSPPARPAHIAVGGHKTTPLDVWVLAHVLLHLLQQQ